ncbi:hypothetical protein FRC10_007862 [Ceratobasidium sp. 414]|nr:hypothetical protein FRC10_007862 [Ceratobasidium sp. 414]
MDPPPQRRTPRRPKRRGLSDSISLIGSYTIGWAAPNEQVRFLVENGDAGLWVGFRDGFMSKWTNLNIVCGLIMGAISTVMFAGVELDSVTFGFGIVSLLSSLISIGFGTGLMYVLGDVAGETLHVSSTSVRPAKLYPHLYSQRIGKRYPILFIFALSIPQVWAGICIVAFFLCIGVFAWNAADKGWTAKVPEIPGIIGSSALTALHLAFFARLFHKQHAIETLIDDEPESGIKHNIHLAHLRASSSDTRTNQSPSQSQTPPDQTERPYVTQSGGSGAGQYRPSPLERQIQNRQLVESPDPGSQAFWGVHESGGGSESAKARVHEDVLPEEPVDLFAASERLARK